MDQRQQLALAFGIAEYATVLDSMEALQRVGQRVPYTVIGKVQSEMKHLLLAWHGAQGYVTMRPITTVVDECRSYVAQHGDELAEMTNRE